MSDRSTFTRRQALAAWGSFVAGSPLLQGQQARIEELGRIAPMEELVNVLEVETMAQRKLDSITFAQIAGSDRRALERITFRPRVMVNATNFDMTLELFGQKLAAPILVGPTSRQSRFHPDGELAMVRGAGAANTAVAISEQSSVPIAKIVGEAKAPLWFQVFPGADPAAARANALDAVKSGCKAVCLTLNVAEAGQGPPPLDWKAIDQMRQGLAVPFLLKGIMTPEETRAAVQQGVQGIVVSSYRGNFDSAFASSIEVLPGIVAEAAGKIPVLIDGSFRRGGDVLKAIALGATAVLLGRPPLWGLAAYGSDGVRYVLDLMQAELVRAMTMCGKPNLKAVDRTAIKVHTR
jgi:isopentenyl diphosphate isomerase/L-lactate dehydrogenase-like FMN-dependent dehydrogenase